LLTAVIFSTYVAFRSLTGKDVLKTREPDLAPGGEGAVNGYAAKPFVGLIEALVLFTVVVGGIYAGILTSTEAAAAGAFAALLIAIFTSITEKRRLLPMLGRSLQETAETSAMIFALLIGSAVFTFLLAYAQVPGTLAGWAASLSLSPTMVVICILLILIPLGMFLDGLSMLLLTVPVVHPIVAGIGVDEIWFGILVVTMIELGLITPPVGLNVYVVAGVVPDLKVEQVFYGVSPFIALQLLVTALIFIFPDIALFLPNLALGQ
ncbi:MAG TPA: TRAP transporter large permease subunit, partial [Rhizobiaceae bacterium]|nr:TRAP transporter large permease subunit [Rhizobiaceae bacterium]